MNHRLSLLLVILCAALALLNFGCGQRSAQNSQDAINIAQEIESREHRVDYLYAQALKFIREEAYSDAQNIARYILTKLDKNSQKGEELMTEIAKKSASVPVSSVKTEDLINPMEKSQ